MEYLVIIALLAGGIWLAVVLTQRNRGRQLTEDIRAESDTAAWDAAKRVALLCNAADVKQAQNGVNNAVDQLRDAARSRDVHDYEHACVDHKLAEGDLEQAIVRSPIAQKAYSLVTALYHRVLTECVKNPRRAKKIYPTIKPRVDGIVQAVFLEQQRKRSNLRVIRGGKDTPITDAEVADFTAALYDGRFDEWARNLKI